MPRMPSVAIISAIKIARLTITPPSRTRSYRTSNTTYGNASVSGRRLNQRCYRSSIAFEIVPSLPLA
jgi:hypothetical protein